jgi:hypothetical protein
VLGDGEHQLAKGVRAEAAKEEAAGDEESEAAECADEHDDRPAQLTGKRGG